MEYWNIGKTNCITHHSIIPVFQYSISLPPF
jgi:hypothetical protein